MCHLVVMWVSGRRSAFGLSLFLLFDFLFDFWRLLLGLEQGLLALFQHLPQVFRGFQLLISRGGCVQAAKKVIGKVTKGKDKLEDMDVSIEMSASLRGPTLQT